MLFRLHFLSLFFFNDTATTEIYTLSLHDALPICATGQPITTYSSHFGKPREGQEMHIVLVDNKRSERLSRSEEHTSELQSRRDLVCRLLLEKKKKKKKDKTKKTHEHNKN